jgi:hypothetical protein
MLTLFLVSLENEILDEETPTSQAPQHERYLLDMHEVSKLSSNNQSPVQCSSRSGPLRCLCALLLLLTKEESVKLHSSRPLTKS